MKGLVIWAHNNCRSTMALYRAIRDQAQVPVRIVMPQADEGAAFWAIRGNPGFRENEFADVQMDYIAGDYGRGLEILDACRGYVHLFCSFQGLPVYRRLIEEAGRRGEIVFAAGESPCNMSSGWRWLVREIYHRTVVRWKVRKVVQVARKFICYSGRGERTASLIGWTPEKVVPFGYFPPPLEGSKCVARQANKPFVILATGILAKYRGADVLVRALKILKDRGVACRAIITQDGELLPRLRRMVERDGLPVEFPGFLPMPELIKLYETCSVYVGAGRSEPWGMRLNDALNCGAPLVVSRGMGGVKLVDDYGCGLAFARGDAADLARQIEILATDPRTYAEVAAKAVRAVRFISPEVKAKEVGEIVVVGSRSRR